MTVVTQGPPARLFQCFQPHTASLSSPGDEQTELWAVKAPENLSSFTVSKVKHESHNLIRRAKASKWSLSWDVLSNQDIRRKLQPE